MSLPAIMIGPLRGKLTNYSNNDPTLGDINVYNTTTSGALTLNLPQLGVQTVGAMMLVEKDANDTTTNTVTFNCYAGDTFSDGHTSLVLSDPGAQRTLEVVSVNSVLVWKAIGSGLGGVGSPVKTGKVPPVRCGTVGTETFTVVSGNVTQINGTALDGVSPAVGDRILVSGAPASTGTGSAFSTQPGNGIYVVMNNATNLTVSRAPEMSSTGLATPAGFSVDVMAGTLYGNITLRVTSPSSGAAFTWGTTAIKWGPANANATGGTLDGVIIGATTASPSINAAQVGFNGVTNVAGSTAGIGKPWLDQTGFFYGSLSGGGSFNELAFNDEVVGDNNYIWGLLVFDHVFSPAIGLRGGVKGQVQVTSTGANTQTQAQYVGVFGRAEPLATIGGTSMTPIGSFWGGWFFGSITTGSHMQAVYGTEIDVYVGASSDVQFKYGLAVGGVVGDSTRGTVDDIMVSISVQDTTAVKWKNGIMFGFNQGIGSGLAHNSWPFASDSTIIGTCAADGTLAANIGIDFSGVTFTGAAFKTGAAHIDMQPMTAPSQVSGHGKLYMASDGLHFLGPTTDTLIAPA